MTAKRDFELKHGEFFARWINENYSHKYKAVLNDDTHSHIDVFLVPQNDKAYQSLNLQVKTPDREPIKQELKFNKTGEVDLINYDLPNWMSEIIEQAEGQYPKEQKQKLILLVAAHIPPLPRTINLGRLSVSHSHSQFKGIYYTVLPYRINGKNHINGHCLKIKDAFK